MNEKIKNFTIYFIFAFVFLLLGAIGGYCFGTSGRSSEIEKLTAKYVAIQRDRDSAVERITEDNKRLRDGNQRAQFELNAATARVDRLEEYIRSAGIGNKQIIADLVGAGQNLKEASGIIEHYLGEQQTNKTNP